MSKKQKRAEKLHAAGEFHTSFHVRHGYVQDLEIQYTPDNSNLQVTDENGSS